MSPAQEFERRLGMSPLKEVLKEFHVPLITWDKAEVYFNSLCKYCFCRIVIECQFVRCAVELAEVLETIFLCDIMEIDGILK